jgi:hypothetical protein
MAAPEEEFMMPRFPLAVSVVTLVLLSLSKGSVAQPVAPVLPLAITCWNEKTQSWRIGYLDSVNAKGIATYVGSSGQLSSRLNASGVVEAPSNRPAALDCYGKTLDQLRAMGRLFEPQQAR